MISKAGKSVLVTFIVCLSSAFGIMYNETKYVHEQLKTFYSNNNKSLTSLIPLKDLSQPITVELTLCLYSVDGFNAVNGQVDISASVYMEWTDETYDSSVGNFDFSNLDTGYSVTISPDAIWTPSIVLLNAVDGVKNVGDSAYAVRYLVQDGRAKWQPRAVIQASCTPNVKFYPFDQQDCSFVYTAWGYTTAEVIIANAQSDWYLCDYTANAVWVLVETSAEEYTKNEQSYVKFKFTIQRAPLFFVINVILPIVMLAFLDGFVFLLPAESGERIGFSVTCFLSFVFMLQTVMSFLPQTAEPMSILCFYVVIMMLASIIQCIITIVMLQIYHKSEDSKVPKSIQKVVIAVTLVWVGPLWRKLKKTCRRPATAHNDNPSAGGDTARTTGIRANPLSLNSIELDKDTPRSTSQSDLDRSYRSASTASTSADTKPSFGIDQTGASTSSGGSASGLSLGNRGNSSGSRQKSASTRTQSGISDDQDEKDIKWPDVGRALDMFFFFAFTAFQLAFTLMYILPMSDGDS